jgi:hypothetical protein
MATIENNYVGNGSTVLYSFTFPYISTEDVKVSLNGVNTTAYIFSNATTLQLTTAPAAGVAVRIFRSTSNDDLEATFYPGSAIRSQDLNNNFLQGLYVAQESEDKATSATITANTATTTANTATTTAATAISTSNTALANSTAAVTTSNTASANASSAVSAANSAISSAVSANNKSDQAMSAVSFSINYTLVANVEGIPVSPANDTFVEVGNSTGIESFTPLAGKPAGFVGDSGLTVRIRYTTSGSTWNWQNYYTNNAESRYLNLAGGTMTGSLTLSGAPTSNLQPATKLYVDGYVSTINTNLGSLSTAKLDSNTAALTYQPLLGMSSYLTTSSATSTFQTIAGMDAYLIAYTTTTTAVSKTLANRERCTVTAGTQTITLPATPAAGWEVAITVAGNFTDTIVARNGVNIMSLAENITLDRANVTVTLYYVDATRGWRII